MIIREAKTEDIDDIIDLYHQLNSWSSYDMDKALKIWKECETNSNYYVIVAEKDALLFWEKSEK